MASELIGLSGFGAVLLLILMRIPVAVAMGLVGIFGYAALAGWRGTAFVLGSAPFEAIFPYSLSVVPLFVLMGIFAAHAGLSRALYEAVYAAIGHRRGGLAMATVGACAGFGAICGSSLATVATMGKVAMPEMRRRGYEDSLASASIAAGGTLGVLIPPSIILVIYALMTEQSIGALFMAALLPGLLGTILYMAAIRVRVGFNPELGPAGPKLQRAEILRVVRDVWGVVALFALVIGGIYLGWFSPTEAAAVGAFGAFLFALARRRLDRRTLTDIVSETANTTGMIFLILIGAGLFNYFIEVSGMPRLLVGWVEAANLSPLVALILIMAFYIALGCFMDSLSMILLTVPFMFPLIVALGYDPIWFGILLVTVVELGLITPPVGMNLFVMQGVAPGLRLITIVRGILPFILADAVRLAILIAFPAIALWLPSVLGP